MLEKLVINCPIVKCVVSYFDTQGCNIKVIINVDVDVSAAVEYKPPLVK